MDWGLLGVFLLGMWAGSLPAAGIAFLVARNRYEPKTKLDTQYKLAYNEVARITRDAPIQDIKRSVACPPPPKEPSKRSAPQIVKTQYAFDIFPGQTYRLNEIVERVTVTGVSNGNVFYRVGENGGDYAVSEFVFRKGIEKPWVGHV